MRLFATRSWNVGHRLDNAVAVKDADKDRYLLWVHSCLASFSHISATFLVNILC